MQICLTYPENSSLTAENTTLNIQIYDNQFEGFENNELTESNRIWIHLRFDIISVVMKFDKVLTLREQTNVNVIFTYEFRKFCLLKYVETMHIASWILNICRDSVVILTWLCMRFPWKSMLSSKITLGKLNLSGNI